MKQQNITETSQRSNETSRRDFLKTAGKIAVYTPPAIMLLMKPGKQAHAIHGSLRGNRLFKSSRLFKDNPS